MSPTARVDWAPRERHNRVVDSEVVDDRLATVRRMLEEHALCETGYAGHAPCRTCEMCHLCADAVERALTQQFPTTEWAPAIRQVLGLW